MDTDLVPQNKVKLLMNSNENNITIKAYKKRWIIMSIFMCYACINGVQWIEYSSITHIVVKYYSVSTLAVNWTSTIYLILYPILVIPASYIIDKNGLRVAGLIGCFGNLIACGIKVLSIRRDLFWVVLLGQAISAVSQLFIVCLPMKLAAVWFRASEVSTACSLGVFGTEMGIAIGYILAPLVVQDSNNIEDIENTLKVLCWLLAGSMIPVTIAVLVCFPEEPPLAPSKAQVLLKQNKEKFNTKLFFSSMKNLFFKKGFVIHVIAYSINNAVFCSTGTLLNQFILHYFEGANEDAGWMGFTLIISGMAGSVVFGILLDKTHKYKEITVFIYLCSALGVTCLMFALKYKLRIMTYISCSIVGTFTNAYTVGGFELGVELTFPSEESTTSGILYAFGQFLGVVCSVALGLFNISYGPFWSLATQAAMLFLGTIVTAYIPNVLLRQQASKLENIGSADT